MAVNDKITLRWTDTNIIENGYRIYKSTSSMDVGSLPPPLAELERNQSDYLDYAVIEDETYYYIVSAFIDNHEVYSNEVSHTFIASTISTVDIFGDTSGVLLFTFDNDLNEIGNTYNPTYTNNLTTGSGIHGSALESLGSGVQFHIPLNYNGSDSIAISCWVNVTSFNRTNIISFGTYSFGSWMESNGTLYFCEGSFDDNPMSAGTTGIQPGEWFHIVFQYGNGVGHYYVDGVLMKTVNGMNPGSHNELYLIADDREVQASQSFPSGSKMDQLRIFNRTLSEDEVLRLYNEIIVV